MRTAVAGDGRFVSTWLAPSSTPGQNDVDGAVGRVAPGQAPSFSPYTFAAFDPTGGNEYVYTPQAAISTDGTGTVEYGIANKIASAGTFMGVTGLSGGSPTGAARTPQAEFEYNPADGNSDYGNYVPALATAGLDSAWNASTSDEQVLLGSNSGGFAQLFTTSSPGGWSSSQQPEQPTGLTAQDASAAVLPDGKIMVASDAYALYTWQSGQSAVTVADPATHAAAGRPAIATYFDGSATIAYLDYDGATGTDTVKEITVAPNGTLGPSETLSPPGLNIRDLTAAYGPDGTTYVVWAATDPVSQADQNDNGIYASVRLPGGAFPTIPDTVIAGPTVHPAAPKIAVDATGFATIIAQVFEPSNGYRIAAFTHAGLILPRLLTAPQISYQGSLKPSTVLTCSTGTWANQPTVFTYSWLIDGQPAGITGAQMTVTAAQVGHMVSCQVVATNRNGSAPGTSAAVTPLAAPLAAPASTVQVRSISVSSNLVTVTLTCPSTASSCRPATIELVVVEHIAGRRVIAITAAGHAKVKLRAVVIGMIKVTVTPGRTDRVRVALNHTGRTLLASHTKLIARLTIVSGATTLTRTNVKLAAAKKHRNNRR